MPPPPLVRGSSSQPCPRGAPPLCGSPPGPCGAGLRASERASSPAARRGCRGEPPPASGPPPPRNRPSPQEPPPALSLLPLATVLPPRCTRTYASAACTPGFHPCPLPKPAHHSSTPYPCRSLSPCQRLSGASSTATDGRGVGRRRLGCVVQEQGLWQCPSAVDEAALPDPSCQGQCAQTRGELVGHIYVKCKRVRLGLLWPYGKCKGTPQPSCRCRPGQGKL